MRSGEYWYRSVTGEDDVTVIAELRAAVLRDGFVVVGDLWVAEGHRRRGLAGRLLGELVTRADRERWDLFLCPAAGGGVGSLGQRDLEAFYRRRGFVPVASGDMIRKQEEVAP